MGQGMKIKHKKEITHYSGNILFIIIKLNRIYESIE